MVLFFKEQGFQPYFKIHAIFPWVEKSILRFLQTVNPSDVIDV